ncbi:choice-of-anchor D domain-containing protein [Flavobacterium sp. 3HN19-14]|uniref:choice-of-anchor D domain-containing protein n=1 Tax=Flavobacterium sp. 3HN19-14 TaxID=3448133 RepID=UPI003EDF1B12
MRYSNSGTSNGANGSNGKITVTYGIAEINVFSAYGINLADNDASPATDKGTLFGSVNTGGFLTSEFIIMNTGNVALTLGTPTFSGANASEFTVLTSPGTSIAAGSTATLVIKFLPLGTGSRTADINFSTNDADENPFGFSLQGTGTAPTMSVTGRPPTPVSIPNNDTTPTVTDGTDFGTQVTAGSVTKTFTITNTGTGLMTITGLTITGSHAADFSIVKSPSATLAVGASTTFSIKFDPSSGAVRKATTTISYDSSTFKFDIQGTNNTSTAADISIYNATATEVPMFAAASSTYSTDFGSINTLDTPVSATFTIKNDSSTLLPLPQSLTGVSVTVTAGLGFTVTSTVALGTILPSGSGTFTIQFDPSTVGTVTAVVTVASSDSNEGSYSFYVTGTGTNPEFDLYGGNPSTMMVDNGAVGTYGTTYGTNFGTQNNSIGYLSRTFKLYNTGNVPLSISSVVNSNTTDYTVSSITSPIPAGGSTTFTITFDPVTTGTKTALITINNNDTNEGAFKINLTGSSVNTSAGEISIKGGSPLTEINMYDPANTSKGTDFGGMYVISGTVAKTFTIYNTGASSLSVSTPVISGTGSADFTITANPSSPVAATSGSTNFTITFNPSATGTRSAMVSITNGDPNESPFTFYIEGNGTTYADSDFDGITDDADIDDDNDGILDTFEQSACASLTTSTTSSKVFLNETFGSGTSRSQINANNPDAATTYSYGSSSLNDGYYTVFNSAQITTWADEYWYRGTDHTGDTNGKMALFNANYTPEKFYTNTISGVTPNVEVTFSFYAINLDRTDATDAANRIRPNIRIEVRKVSDNTLISSLSTGNIGLSPSGTATASDWINYALTFTTSETTFKVIFINNAPGGTGNDIAIDDITVSQKYCDINHDNDADVVDLDDDNDGISDIVEAGFKSLSNNKSRMDISDSTVWKDVNENGFNDTLEPYVTPTDTDGDGIFDFMDLDSDNDSIFDIDEAQVDSYYVNNSYASYNGDGDVDGDGKGDSVDTDGDGILDLNDDSSAYGSSFKAYPADSDTDGIPNYQDLTSNGSTKDIAGTLYANLDANNDGKIDGTADVDKDGIMDTFDSINLVDPLQRNKSVGSPRDITNKNYLIDFDGRNDYAESDYLFSNSSTTDKATMMGWFKLDANFPATDGVLFGQDKFYITVSGSPTRKITVTAGTYTATYATTLDVSRWYHVAASFDSSGLKLYINGTLVTTTPVSLSIPANTAKFTIAKTPGATAGLVASKHFRGFIDEVRVFSTSLTADQIQKMVYQKISQNGTAIRGATIPRDIESSSWSSLKAYYKLDDYKGNVADDYIIAGTDNSTFVATNTNYCRIYNVKYIKTETAPMPFVTKQAGVLDAAAITNTTTFINCPDVTANNFSIVQVKHDVTLGNDLTNLGLIVDPGKTLSVNNDNKIENTWYLELNGKIDLVGKSQSGPGFQQ